MSLELEQVYTLAKYAYAFSGQDIALRIGGNSVEHERCMKNLQVEQWAFITAFNPHSKILSSRENINNNKALQRTLDHQGWRYLPAYSESGDQQQP